MPRTALLLLLLACPATAMGGPALSRIEPPAAQRGTDVEILISGSELEEPQEVFFEEGHITVKAVAEDKANVVKATLAIPADCPLGPHRLLLALLAPSLIFSTVHNRSRVITC